MINASTTGLVALVYQLSMYDLMVELRPDGQDSPLPQEVKDQALGWLQIAVSIADQFEIKDVHYRIELFKEAMGKNPNWRVLSTESRVLRQALENGLTNQFLYRYPTEQGTVFSRWLTDWESVLEKFPAARADIWGAVDCWAMSHWTASVFYSMRVVEFGLAALAQDVGIQIGVQTWQNIIDRVEAKVRELGKTLPSGKEKNARLQFLSETAKEVVYFKDGWRNYVSHHRATYDQYQARGALEHVRSFMTVLSRRLSEVPSWNGGPS